MDKKVTNDIYISKLKNELNNLNTENDMRNLLTEVNKEEVNSNQKNPKKKYIMKEDNKGKNVISQRFESSWNINMFLLLSVYNQ